MQIAGVPDTGESWVLQLWTVEKNAGVRDTGEMQNAGVRDCSLVFFKLQTNATAFTATIYQKIAKSIIYFTNTFDSSF